MSTASNQSTRFFAAFLVASVFLHGVGIFAFWGLTQLFTPKPPPFSQTVIRTKLVKLGKKRENAAPAKPEATAQPKPESAKPPPKEPPKKEAVKVPDNKPNTPKPSAKDVLKDFSDKKPTDLNALINNTVGEDTEGDERGSQFGDALVGRMKANYNDKVRALIRAQYKVPSTLTNDELVQLKAVLTISIEASGSITRARISRSSGNSSNDNAVLGAAKKATLPPPPIPLRSLYEGGVSITICPASCQ